MPVSPIKFPVNDRVRSVRLRRKLDANAAHPSLPIELELKFKCSNALFFVKVGTNSLTNKSVMLQLFNDSFTKLKYGESNELFGTDNSPKYLLDSNKSMIGEADVMLFPSRLRSLKR